MSDKTSAWPPDLQRVTSANGDPSDHIAIKALSNVFEIAFDENDVEMHMATWDKTLIFRSDFGDFNDHASYREWVVGFMKQMSEMGGTRHLITNTVIDVEGHEAHQSCYLTVVGAQVNDGKPDLFGTLRFDDHLVCTTRGWRFRKRVLNLDQDIQKIIG